MTARSADSGYSSCSSCDLPPTSYDGSHLQWKKFRSDVLAPHHIQVLEVVPKERLPQSLLSLIETGMADEDRFQSQKNAFREQVVTGRGFGPSPLFPPNLLPSTEDEPRLTQCMVPSFSREALPERLSKQSGPMYELSVPRSGLVCGFSASAFSGSEINTIPSYLVPTGTIVNFETGYISPGAAVYCPFLTFERAFGVKEHRLEAANNQCAIAGAWCVRALQMLYLKAGESDPMLQSPVAFSCSIDNSFAIINFHWLGPNQTYLMSPLCKFDLSKDDHFTKFPVWIEAIGKFALDQLLPTIKHALLRLGTASELTPPLTNGARNMTLSLDTGSRTTEVLMKSLKTTFDNIPWRYDDEECTPVSSSTASWGSPMVTDITFAYNDVTPARSADSGITIGRRRMMLVPPSVQSRHPLTPAPGLDIELEWQERLNEATEKIHTLQDTLSSLRNTMEEKDETMHLELASVKAALASVLRKETLVQRNRSLSAGPVAGLRLAVPSESWDREGRITTTNENASRVVVHVTENSASRQPPSPSSSTTNQCSQVSSTTATTAIKMVEPSPTPIASSNLSSIRLRTTSGFLAKWTAIAVTTHTLAAFFPVTALRLVALGCATEVALLVFMGDQKWFRWIWQARRNEVTK